MTENRNSLQSYAMQFGAYMGLFWILKFILFPAGLSTPFLMFLFMGLTLGVPFMGYRFARMYRDRVCKGSIGFIHAWLFTLFMYMFAALLVAVAHYVYFQYLDHGYMVNIYTTIYQEAKALNAPELTHFLTLQEEALKAYGSLSPIEITMQLMSSNVFLGSLLALPTALLIKRSITNNNKVETTK